MDFACSSASISTTAALLGLHSSTQASWEKNSLAYCMKLGGPQMTAMRGGSGPPGAARDSLKSTARARSSCHRWAATDCQTWPGFAWIEHDLSSKIQLKILKIQLKNPFISLSSLVRVMGVTHAVPAAPCRAADLGPGVSPYLIIRCFKGVVEQPRSA